MLQKSSEKEFPISQVREQFPALKRTYHNKPVVYFDGPGGSQVLGKSIENVAAYMSNGVANLHGPFPTSVETEEILAQARNAIADLVSAKPTEVAFGANMTTLAFAIGRALSRDWRAGDEIVVTEMDHRANVDPWLSVAEDLGMTVRWIKVNPTTLTLNLDDIDALITEKTKLVAVGLASNAVGTVNDVQAIANRAKAVGALVAVDAVHAIPHIHVNRDEIGADLLLCSAYKFFGPHVGIAIIRESLFEELHTYKLNPAPTHTPDKLETGTQNHEGIAGIEAAVNFIADLGQGNTRSEKIESGFERISQHEDDLSEKIRAELAVLPTVRVYQASESIPKTPTIAFQVEGIEAQEFCKRMADEYSIFTAGGDFYASTLASILKVHKNGGWIRVGLAPYNTEEEVDRFIDAVKDIISSL